MIMCISLCLPDFTELKIKAKCPGERNRKANNNNSKYLWILIKDTLFSLQQNDLFFLPEPATRFKGESKDKGKENKKKRKMETKMGLSKCRITLGKKSDSKSRVWSCPQGSRYGWAYSAWCRDEWLMHSYEQNISSVCGVSPISSCSLSEEMRYIFWISNQATPANYSHLPNILGSAFPSEN